MDDIQTKPELLELAEKLRIYPPKWDGEKFKGKRWRCIAFRVPSEDEVYEYPNGPLVGPIDGDREPYYPRWIYEPIEDNSEPAMVTAKEIKEIDDVWQNANFGPETSRIDVIKYTVLKNACGYYHSGSTASSIVTELGLVYRNGILTKRGQHCLWEWFKGGYR